MKTAKPLLRFQCLLYILFFPFIIVSAQNKAGNTFILEEDNKAIEIYTVYKNAQGYLFAGSSKGLYKFDGSRYFRINFNNTDYTDTVTAIFEASDKKMWVGFRSGRIGNVKAGKLAYFNPEEGTPAKKITSFVQDKEGKIWFSTNGEGVYYIKNNRLYLIDADNGLSDLNVSSLSVTPDGNILAATDQGLNIISFIKDRASVKVVGPAQGLPDYIVTAIMPAGKNGYWIGLEDHGLCAFDFTTGKITVPSAAKNWHYGQVNAIQFSGSHIYIGTDEGLLSFNAKDYNEGFKQITTLKVNSIVRDDQENIWVAGSSGLVRIPGESVTTFPLLPSTVFEHIHAILADATGNIWLTNELNEIIRTNPRTNKTTRIHLNGITATTDITSLYQDHFGNIWIGAMGKGIYILDTLTNRYRVFTENPVFKDAGILSITGKGNAVFASSLQGTMEITLLAENKNIYSTYSYNNFDKAGIGSGYIYTIFKDSRGRTWFATDGNGIAVKVNNEFTRFDAEDRIKDDRIFSITEDHNGNIWFSTGSAGIYKYDGKQFRNYGVREGLSDLNISAIKTDRWGNIVIIHKKGLDILDPHTHSVSYINRNLGIGMLNVEDLGAVSQDLQGNIFISSAEGIVLYAPQSAMVPGPKTILESVQLFRVPTDSNVHVYNHEDNNFTFTYTGLYYTDPEQVNYQYKLEGFDTSWIRTRDRSQTFSRLPPGKYTFHIRSALNRNFINADEQSWTFEIKQAFYRQWWFLILCVMILAGLLYWYIRSREASFKRLERLRRDKIESRFEVLRNQVNPHFLFNSFNTLISTIEEDPKMAVEYVEQLSDFFRNIVNYRDKDVIELNEEMGLLMTYYFLQKKRYGDNLQVEINLTEKDKRNCFIPPLSLQLLMENAIKHNIITAEAPLIIYIDVLDGNYLQVKNRINLRISQEPGAGMGLQNIISRYHLLTNKRVLITDKEGYFIVSLPLIHMNNA